MFLIAIICYLFIYYSSHTLLFTKYNYIAIFSTKPIFFSYIYGLIGFYLYSINIVEELNKYKRKIIIFCLILLFLYYKKLTYYLIIINSLASTSLFILFIIIPFEKLNNRIFINIIKNIANYSAGIYYLHEQIQCILDFFSKKSNTIFVCIINYLLCNLICFMGLKYCKKSNLRYLFI